MVKWCREVSKHVGKGETQADGGEKSEPLLR